MHDSLTTGNLGQKRTQAKELLKAVRSGEPEALRRALVHFPATGEFRLANAQLVIARESGFDSWPAMQRELGKPKQTDRLEELFEAADSLDAQRVQELVAASPNLAGCWRRTDYGGWESVLHVAAKRGSLEVARILVEAGAEVYAVRQSDYPPVFEASYSGNPALTEYLLEESAKRDEGHPPTFGCGIDIVCASRIGMLDRVLMHLKRDPFAIYRRGCIGETVLHWPAHNGFVEVVEALIAAGAVVDADEIGLYGGKPLHWASEHEPKTVRVLLEHGADPNSRNLMPGHFEGYTPLHMCACQKEQCIECAEQLLKAGTDIYATCAKGETALEVARRNGHTRMADYLSSRM